MDTELNKLKKTLFFKGCENLKLSSERIARVLAEESGRSGRGRLSAPRQPKCRDDDGEFEEVQCDHETVTSCWCVDATGFEVCLKITIHCT